MRNFFKNLAFLLLLAASHSVAAEWRYDGVGRVVAIADVHGDYFAMLETLQQATVLDDDSRWVGGTSHLVVVGDMLDRGPGSRRVMELLMRLEPQAANAGGKVHVLIGNHESMLLTGDMRYVSAAEYAAFADDEDIDERARWRALFMERGKGNMKELGASFEERFPPGYFAMRRAFRADGRYGEWLLQKNIIEVLNGTAFVHGGLPPVSPTFDSEFFNIDARSELREYVEALSVLTDASIILPTDSHYDYEQILLDYRLSGDAPSELRLAIGVALAAQDSVLLSSDGPLWYRSNVLCQQRVEETRLQQALDVINAERLVVGHTPTATRRIQQRFDGKLFEIDTGMLGSHYHGTGNALILDETGISVITQSGERVEHVPAHPRRVGRRAAVLDAESLQSLLQDGDVVARGSQLGDDPRSSIVTVSAGDAKVAAVFTEQRERGVLPNVAAYRLDRMLDLEMVPVAVPRSIDGTMGSLQFLPERRIDEGQRSSTGEGGDAHCSLADQWAAMYVFDALIYNTGRSQQRILYEPSSWHLMLTGHGDAFSSKKGRPAHLRKVKLVVDDGWRQLLRELDDDVLAANFADVLDARRIKALAARRDQLIKDSRQRP